MRDDVKNIIVIPADIGGYYWICPSCGKHISYTEIEQCSYGQKLKFEGEERWVQDTMPYEIVDTEKYKLAVRYMAETELYDRTLTDIRSPYDPTEALPIKQWHRQWSEEFAHELMNRIGLSNIKDEIDKHSDYSAQRWVDEYYRIFTKGG